MQNHEKCLCEEVDKEGSQMLSKMHSNHMELNLTKKVHEKYGHNY
jgi:hypothetical protein